MQALLQGKGNGYPQAPQGQQVPANGGSSIGGGFGNRSLLPGGLHSGAHQSMMVGQGEYRQEALVALMRTAIGVDKRLAALEDHVFLK